MRTVFGHPSLFKWTAASLGLVIFCAIGAFAWSFSQSVRHDPQSRPTHTTAVHPQPTAATTPAPSATPPPHPYIALGAIPVEGMQIGVTFYGALESPENGHYVLSNLLQGGVKNGGAYDGYDDNGEGACEGKYTNLTNQATWAEDDNGTILGQLPCGTKLEISYRSHTIIAEKGDTSNGGCTAPSTRCSDNGHIRMIDLWWQTAKALCFTDQPDTMTIHVVPASTPTTPLPAYSRSDPQSTATCQ